MSTNTPSTTITKFDPKKLIVESTLTPLDQLTKLVDEHYSTAMQLPDMVSAPDNPNVKVRLTINMFPYKPGLLRIQWHTEFSSEKHPVTLHANLAPDKVLEKLYAALDPWIGRLHHDVVKNEVKIVGIKPQKCHFAVLMCVKSDTDPDKFHPDDKDAVTRIQHVVLKLAMEHIMPFFFGEMIPLEDGASTTV